MFFLKNTKLWTPSLRLFKSNCGGPVFGLEKRFNKKRHDGLSLVFLRKVIQ